MPLTDASKAFIAHVVDIMQCVGPVYEKRMFGGFGVFLDGIMIALVADDTLFLKVDDKTQDLFISQDLEPFTYMKNGKPCQLSYYQAPEEALEDTDAMRHWGGIAFEAALRASKKK